MIQPEGEAKHQAAGVVVTYFPDEGLLSRLRGIASEVGRLYVVDNGSPPDLATQLRDVSWIEWMPLGENLGLGAALNTGLRRAESDGYRWVVTFDQDSEPIVGMVTHLQQKASQFQNVAVVGPVIVEDGFGASSYRWIRASPRTRWLFRRASVGAELDDVTLVITSGSLVSMSCWRALGGFDDALFIDYVDVEFCLRARRAGLRIAVAEAARLKHHLGRRSTLRMLGHDFRPMNHAPFRHYYMARNRVTVWRRHACAQPHWALFDFSFAVYNGFRAVVLEQHRWLKLKAMVLGTWDGLHGRSGPMPEHRARALRP